MIMRFRAIALLLTYRDFSTFLVILRTLADFPRARND